MRPKMNEILIDNPLQMIKEVHPQGRANPIMKMPPLVDDAGYLVRVFPRRLLPRLGEEVVYRVLAIRPARRLLRKSKMIGVAKQRRRKMRSEERRVGKECGCRWS